MGRECYHCHEWIEDKEEHDCWTTTEKVLTADLSEDLMDAWERLRETVSEFGKQRIYASHKSIMFSRKACYFFVRPKKKFLEIWFPGTEAQSANDPQDTAVFQIEGGAPGSGHPPRPGRATSYGVA